MPCDETRGKVSDARDSGIVVLARDGRVVGIFTGGEGPPSETDVTYLTPYWWVEQQVKVKYPDCFLYEPISSLGCSDKLFGHSCIHR